MKQFSISLGKFFGIPVTIHWTFWILIIWIVYINISQGQGGAATIWYILFVFAIFACVVLHELGHALAARKYGIKTRSITILPIGGVAALEKIPEDPSKELVVAIAGPLVNVLIAILLFIYVAISGPVISGAEESLQEMTRIHAGNFLLALLSVNVLLVLFNLIPAFPMDGGRIFRALLAFKMHRVKATEWAVNVGKVFAILFVFWGFSNNPFLIFIALFIFIGAQSELQMVRTGSFLKGHTVKDIVMREFTVIESDSPLSQAVEILLNSQEKGFLVRDEDRIAGVLTKMEIIRGLKQLGENAPVKDVMYGEFSWLNPDTSLEDANLMMMKERTGFMPVGSEGQLVGVLDSDNLSEFLMVQNALIQK